MLLNGARGELSARPLCEGVGRRFSRAHALEPKGDLEFSMHPTLKFWCPPKGSNLVLLLGGLG